MNLMEKFRSRVSTNDKLFEMVYKKKGLKGLKELLERHSVFDLGAIIPLKGKRSLHYHFHVRLVSNGVMEGMHAGSVQNLKPIKVELYGPGAKEPKVLFQKPLRTGMKTK